MASVSRLPARCGPAAARCASPAPQAAPGTAAGAPRWKADLTVNGAMMDSGWIILAGLMTGLFWLGSLAFG
jgi:hypothetical protein